MTKTSSRMGWPYPSENDDPWYEGFRDFVSAADLSAYASREDRQLVIAEGGTVAWSAGTSSLSWSDDLKILSPITGRVLTVAAATVTLDDGKVLYATLIRAPTTNSTVSVAQATQVPTTDQTLLLAARVGTRVYWRNGLVMNDGDSFLTVGASQGGGGGTDVNAIHDNVAAEIQAIAEKVTPASADLILIEDSALAYNKKKVQVGNLTSTPTAHASTHEPGGGDALTVDAAAATGSLRTLGTGAQQACAGNDSRLSDNRTDADAIHDNVAAEISAIAAKATPTTSDYLSIEDAAAANAKKSITIGDLPAAAPASHASTHEPGGGDALTVDAAAATGSLRTLGTGATQACAGNDSRLSDNRTDADAIHDNVSGEIALITEKVTPVSADLIVIEDSAAANAKKRVQIGNLPGGSGTDADAIHDNVAGEIALVTEKTTPVSADLLLIEDSADSNNKKRVQVGNLPGGTTATAAEATSYRELASNALDTQGVSVVENDVGEGVFNAGLHQSLIFRATLTAGWASTGTLTVTLYDDGPTSAPGTPRAVTSFAKTANGGYEVFEQALTIVSSGAGSNEVLGEARVYRVTIEVDGSTGDTGYIGSAGLVATGSAETLSADEVQAIAMSLNA